MNIPEAAIEAAAARILGHNRLEARHALEAAMPAIREAIAQQIETDRDAVDWNKSYRNGMDHASSIVRGGAA